MIISKDLFIFGEHIFAKILPEVATTTTTTTTALTTTTTTNIRRHQHHQQQRYASSAIPATTLVTTTTTTTAITSTPTITTKTSTQEKTGRDKILLETTPAKLTAAVPPVPGAVSEAEAATAENVFTATEKTKSTTTTTTSTTRTSLLPSAAAPTPTTTTTAISHTITGKPATAATTTPTTIPKAATKEIGKARAREQRTFVDGVSVATADNDLPPHEVDVDQYKNCKNNEFNFIKIRKEDIKCRKGEEVKKDVLDKDLEKERDRRERCKGTNISKVKEEADTQADSAAEELITKAETPATTTTTTTEREQLLRRLTKITSTSNTKITATAPTFTPSTGVQSTAKLLAGLQPQPQQQQQQQSNDCCLQLDEEPSSNILSHLALPASARIKTTISSSSPTSPLLGVGDSGGSDGDVGSSGASSREKIIKNSSHSVNLSRKMRKVMLGNNTVRGDDHGTMSFPFISEQHRTLQLSFQNINVLHNDRHILSDVSGLVSPGEVLAIMGPSGCGKTTLLDCLSGQRRIDGGTIYLNREPLSKKWRRKICYVLQEEIFFTGLTLRETVKYTALLRLPERMPREEKMKLVDRILEALELKFCQQTKFGDYLNRGLSGGEKKRANIACELLTNPLLMLLDEPTSGLDSHSAISLMKVLKRYALQEQKTVVITVHQPSSQMFHMFDKLLLLHGGRTAYFGDVKNIYRYFENIGVAIKPHYNPADFVLEQIKSYPDIREKLFIAAKESHGNFLNRNCITLSTNNSHHHHDHHHHRHHQISNGIGGHKPEGFTVSSTITNANGNGITAIAITNEKTCSHHQHNTLITDIMQNYYQNQTNHNHNQSHNQNHNLNHNHNHQHNNRLKHEDLVLLNNHHNCVADEEAAQHLWCGSGGDGVSDGGSCAVGCGDCDAGCGIDPIDSQSNFSSGSSDCHQYETAEGWLGYPTRFHTQFRVLSSRNFKEAKPRMLSKLNWFQTIGLALMAGAIWFQIPRTESFLHDLQGWMFFSQTYWMLFALFGALNSFPSEREVISKERRSGAYRLSAYYLAKMFGELPLVVTLPTVYLMISYPMLGCASFKLFFLMLVFLLLNTIVAQSVGFFIGACCMDMNVSITLSALYTLATQLFGGYLSSRIPEGLSWIRYTSMIHYAYQNMQILEFREGPAIRCGSPSSYEICKTNSTIFIPYNEILKAQNSSSPLWLNTLILMMFFMVFRALGYAVLRYLRCPKT